MIKRSFKKLSVMRINILTILILSGVVALSCQKEENVQDVIKGNLSINIGLFVTVNEVENNLKSTMAGEDFKVSILKPGGEEILSFERASDIPAQIELDPGQYYVVAYSDNNLPAAFENPYYYGESAVFTITAAAHQNVTVNCELANTIVSIVYSDLIKTGYADYRTIVSTSAGSLTFTKSETRSGYFQPLPLNISVMLKQQKSDGTMDSVKLTGNIPAPQPKKKYEIHVDAPLAEGLAAFQIVVDETIDPVEIITISDGSSFTGLFGPGDILITEIMYDPASLSDSEGEWFEIFNNTNKTLDLNHLIIRKNTTEQHTIDSSILVNSHSYYILSRTKSAVSGIKYVYGSSISLNNTGAVLSLYNYGSNGNDGSLICSVNYGAVGFPSGSGASIGLSPLLLNVNDMLSGSSWCTSVTSYGTGDLGTPGNQNDSCL
jgi:hypothetical protein